MSKECGSFGKYAPLVILPFAAACASLEGRSYMTRDDFNREVAPLYRSVADLHSGVAHLTSTVSGLAASVGTSSTGTAAVLSGVAPGVVPGTHSAAGRLGDAINELLRGVEGVRADVRDLRASLTDVAQVGTDRYAATARSEAATVASFNAVGAQLGALGGRVEVVCVDVRDLRASLADVAQVGTDRYAAAARSEAATVASFTAVGSELGTLRGRVDGIPIYDDSALQRALRELRDRQGELLRAQQQTDNAMDALATGIERALGRR